MTTIVTLMHLPTKYQQIATMKKDAKKKAKEVKSLAMLDREYKKMGESWGSWFCLVRPVDKYF